VWLSAKDAHGTGVVHPIAEEMKSQQSVEISGINRQYREIFA
jgi:hypothetical protein